MEFIPRGNRARRRRVARQPNAGQVSWAVRRRTARLLECLEARRLLDSTPLAELFPAEDLELGVLAAPVGLADVVDPYDNLLSAAAPSLAMGPAAALPLTSIPILHSLPGAAASIYLDFDGHFEPIWGSYSNISTPVFDIDGDPTTFSDLELTRIANIWARVAEDFAPFQINVTTENPGNFSNGVGLRIAIGGSYDWYGSPAGGVAYVNSFTSSVANTAYVFPNALGLSEKSIAEAASHEAGHAFGLRHQSVYDTNGIKTAEYNPGGAGWAPIMGVSYYQPLTTWHNGTSAVGSTVLQDDMAVIASALNAFGYRPDDHADSVGGGTPLSVDGHSVFGAGVVEYMTDVDAFAFATDAGTITLIVDAAPLGPNLDVILELHHDQNGLVATANPSNSQGAVIIADVPAGDYTLLVKSTGLYGRVGQYTVSGAINAGLFVHSHTPAQGSAVTELPVDFQIVFSEAIDLSTVDAGDLLVNGISADSFTVVDDQIIDFHFLATPVSGQGLQSLQMAMGAVDAADDGAPLNPFTGSFRYDALPLAVVSSGPAADAIVPLPLQSITLEFNEPFDPATLNAADLLVSVGQVSGVTIDGPSTLTFTVVGIETEGTLQFGLAAGALADEFGNPSLAYSASVALDYVTTAFPLPLAPITPLGGRIYQSSIEASIGIAGDEDTFTIELPAGVTLSAVVHAQAGLQPMVELLGPAQQALGSASAAAAGEAALLQTIAAAEPGEYRIRVSGLADTAGAYSLRLTLNAAVEAEYHGGVSNHTIATAQNIDASFIDLGAGMQRGAAIGVTDPPAGLLAEQEPNGSIAATNWAADRFGPGPAERYHLGVSGSIGTFTDQDWYRIGQLQAGDVITISLSGVSSSRGTLADPLVELRRGATGGVLVASNDDGGPSLDSLIYRFTISTADTYFINARGFSGATGSYQLGVFLENFGAPPTVGGSVTTEGAEPNNTAATSTNVSSSWRAVQYATQLTGTITAGDADYFAFQFHAGDLVSVFVDATSGTLDATATWYNSAGIAIAQENGASIGPGADSPLYGVRIPTDGAYYLRVQASSGTGAYTASVYLSSNTPPPTHTGRSDVYAFSLQEGEAASVVVTGMSAGELTLEMIDADENVLAVGAAGPANVDRVIEGFVAPAAGQYFIRVDGDPEVAYSVVVTRQSTFDTEQNDDPDATLVSLNSLQGVAGHLNAHSPEPYGALGFMIDATQSYVALAGVLAGELSLEEQAAGSLLAHYAGTLVVVRQPTYVAFQGGSQILALTHPGPFPPVNGPANYAGQLADGDEVFAYGTFSNIAIDLWSPLQQPLPHDLLLDEDDDHDHNHDFNANQFPANNVLVNFVGGDFDYDLPGLFSGSESVAGLSELNQFDGPGQLEEIGGVLWLTLPILIDTSLIEPTSQLEFGVHLEGQLIAFYELPGPIDPVDWYELHLAAGEQLIVSTSTPWDDSPLFPPPSLDPRIEILNADGQLVALDDNSAADGKNALLTFVASAAGTYRIGVRAVAGEGDYLLHTSIGAPAPPAVIQVAVRGAGGTQPWHEIETGSGMQLRSVPVGQVDQIAVTFSVDVQIDQDDLSLTGLGDRPPYTFSDFAYDPVTRTAVWTLDGAVDTDQLALVLNADGPSPIVNAAGQALDGEWNNPVDIWFPTGSVFPSGDGVAGGDFVFTFTVLPGDANRDNVVDMADYTTWADRYLQPGSLATQGDFNNDGFVDGADYTIWADRYSPVSPIPAAAVESPVAAAVDSALAAADLSPQVQQRAAGLALPAAVQRKTLLRREVHELALAAISARADWDNAIVEIARDRGRFRRGA